jgi:hypothetical protein
VSEETHNPLAYDLAFLAAQADVDGQLYELLELADAGVGMGIGLLLNGMIAIGRLDHRRAMAREIDEAGERVAQLVRRPDDVNEDDWSGLQDRLRGGATGETKETDVRKAELEEDWAATGLTDPSLAPNTLARRAASVDSRVALTLVDVQLVAPPSNGVMQIPVLRVYLPQIAAWWPLRLDDTGSATVNFFA